MQKQFYNQNYFLFYFSYYFLSKVFSTYLISLPWKKKIIIIWSLEIESPFSFLFPPLSKTMPKNHWENAFFTKLFNAIHPLLLWLDWIKDQWTMNMDRILHVLDGPPKDCNSVPSYRNLSYSKKKSAFAWHESWVLSLALWTRKCQVWFENSYNKYNNI